jgi:hypothetical protein
MSIEKTANPGESEKLQIGTNVLLSIILRHKAQSFARHNSIKALI